MIVRTIEYNSIRTVSVLTLCADNQSLAATAENERWVSMGRVMDLCLYLA